jgi:hypothetical protein
MTMMEVSPARNGVIEMLTRALQSAVRVWATLRSLLDSVLRPALPSL